MTKKVAVPEKFRDYVESLFYEKDNKKDLLVFMLGTNNNNVDMFDKIHTEYFEYFVQCEQAKKEIERHFVSRVTNEYLSWNFDFRGKEITIKCQE